MQKKHSRDLPKLILVYKLNKNYNITFIFKKKSFMYFLSEFYGEN